MRNTTYVSLGRMMFDVHGLLEHTGQLIGDLEEFGLCSVLIF